MALGSIADQRPTNPLEGWSEIIKIGAAVGFAAITHKAGRDQGYSAGYQRREAEMRPRITYLESEVAAKDRQLDSKQRQLETQTQENARLQQLLVERDSVE